MWNQPIRGTSPFGILQRVHDPCFVHMAGGGTLQPTGRVKFFIVKEFLGYGLHGP